MSIGVYASRFAPCMYERYLKSSRLKQQQRVAKLLARSSPPTFLDSDALYNVLQNRSYAKPAAYRYDDFSGFSHAAERLVRLGNLLPELKSTWAFMAGVSASSETSGTVSIAESNIFSRIVTCVTWT